MARKGEKVAGRSSPRGKKLNRGNGDERKEMRVSLDMADMAKVRNMRDRVDMEGKVEDTQRRMDVEA